MCVVCIDELASVPSTIPQEQTAELVWTMKTTDGSSKTATVEYTLDPGNTIVFHENRGKRITADHLVNGTDTVTRRRYALTGGHGIVTIRSHVVQGPPCSQSQNSTTAVNVTP